MDTIVKQVNFGVEARETVMTGVEKLAKAVMSTLGASGKCVLLEDDKGNPLITKDGVTVAETITLLNPVENMGAKLIRQAASRTVEEAGDGTTTATTLAYALLKEALTELENGTSFREIKDGIDSAVKKVVKYLEKSSIPVKGSMLENVATISANNDRNIGKIIADAFLAVDLEGVVTMELSDNPKTSFDVTEGAIYDHGLMSREFATNEERTEAVLENPLVLLTETKIPNVRRIQNVLEATIKAGRSLLIIGECEREVMNTLALNTKKGKIKCNIITPPYYGPARKDQFDDLALVTGATVVNEDLGDDLDIIDLSMLGEINKSITDATRTTLLFDSKEEITTVTKSLREQIKETTDNMKKHNLEKRLGMLEGSIAVVKVGAETPIELKELADRVEDAICAVKAAVKEGIVSGGGVALLNASTLTTAKNKGEEALLKAIKAPYETILANAGILPIYPEKRGTGLNVISGKNVNMIKAGIIDPLLVTKSALTNAASVASTILSTDCVINNLRA